MMWKSKTTYTLLSISSTSRTNLIPMDKCHIGNENTYRSTSLSRTTIPTPSPSIPRTQILLPSILPIRPILQTLMTKAWTDMSDAKNTFTDGTPISFILWKWKWRTMCLPSCLLKANAILWTRSASTWTIQVTSMWFPFSQVCRNGTQEPANTSDTTLRNTIRIMSLQATILRITFTMSNKKLDPAKKWTVGYMSTVLSFSRTDPIERKAPVTTHTDTIPWTLSPRILLSITVTTLRIPIPSTSMIPLISLHRTMFFLESALMTPSFFLPSPWKSNATSPTPLSDVVSITTETAFLLGHLEATSANPNAIANAARTGAWT